jgi:hypothetical protein
VLDVVDDDPTVCDDPQYKLIEVNPPSSWLQEFDGNLSLDFTNLENGALGQANQNGITFDDDANGYGWYIDLTPGLNEENLATSDPYEWKAKPG